MYYLAIKISHLPNKRLYQLSRLFSVLDTIIPIVFISAIVWWSVYNPTAGAIGWVWFLGWLLASALISICQRTLQKGLSMILYENIELERYRVCMAMFKKRYEKRVRSRLTFGFSMIHLNFIEGKSREALRDLEELKPQIPAIKGVKGLEFQLLYYRYMFLIKVFSKDTSDQELQSIIEKLNNVPVTTGERLLRFKLLISKEIAALYDIVISHVANNYFATIIPNSRLQSLLYQYYQALNAKNNNDRESAIQLFRNLAVENNNLFFVKAAQEELHKGE